MRVLLLIVLSTYALWLQAAPPPGHPSTDRAAELMGIEKPPEFSFKGRVLQAIDSNNYSYIEVQADNQAVLWLAAPKLKLQAGQLINFTLGRLMHNFYSQKHKRTFEQIWFVSQVKPLL